MGSSWGGSGLAALIPHWMYRSYYPSMKIEGKVGVKTKNKENKPRSNETCLYLCYVGFLESEPVLRPAEDVVDLVDVEAHLEELALHQAVPEFEKGGLPKYRNKRGRRKTQGKK